MLQYWTKENNSELIICVNISDEAELRYARKRLGLLTSKS